MNGVWPAAQAELDRHRGARLDRVQRGQVVDRAEETPEVVGEGVAGVALAVTVEVRL